MNMKTAISIPDELFEAADRVAKHLGLSRSELYQRAIAKFIQDKSDAAVTEKLDSLYQSAEESQVDPALDALQQASLAREDW